MLLSRCPTHLLLPLALRKEILWDRSDTSWGQAEQTDFCQARCSLSSERKIASFYTRHKPLEVATNGAVLGWRSCLLTRSCFDSNLFITLPPLLQRFEQIELQAKLLNYFLRIKATSINPRPSAPSHNIAQTIIHALTMISQTTHGCCGTLTTQQRDCRQPYCTPHPGPWRWSDIHIYLQHIHSPPRGAWPTRGCWYCE